MTSLPDSAELAPSRDPATYGARPLLSRGFWLMMGFCVLCLAAALAVVVLGPRFIARRARVETTAPAAAATPAPLFTPMGAPPNFANPAPAGVSALEARLSRVEANQARLIGASQAALAASAIADAAAQPRPFAGEMAAYGRGLAESPDARALFPLATQGAPTRPALAANLAALAAKASVAARQPGKDAGIMAQIGYALSRVVNVRRLDEAGEGADASLARAQRRAELGDMEGAAALVDKLPAPARAGLADWREAARRRIEIDRHVAGLRAQVLADLGATAGPPP